MSRLCGVSRRAASPCTSATRTGPVPRSRGGYRLSSCCPSQAAAASGVELCDLTAPEPFRLAGNDLRDRPRDQQAIRQLALIGSVPVLAERLHGGSGRVAVLNRLNEADRYPSRVADGDSSGVRDCENALTCGPVAVTRARDSRRDSFGDRRGPVHEAPRAGVVTPDRGGLDVYQVGDERLDPRLGTAVDHAPAALDRRGGRDRRGADERLPVLRLVAAHEPHPDRVPDALDRLRLDVLPGDQHVLL